MLSKFLGFFNFTFKRGVPFDPKLIEKFNGDHRKLVSIAVDIKQQASDTKNKQLVRSMLKTLKVELFAHFAHEEKTLYKYLDALYKNDEDNRELVKEFNKSMHDIQIFVEDFMEKYTDSAVHYDDEFIKDFDGLVEALAKRIDTEENHLYSLYNKKIKTIDEGEFLKVERTAEEK